MKRLFLAVIAVFLFFRPAFGYDDQLSPTEDTFVDSLYQNQAMGDESGEHYDRIWAGPVINTEADYEAIGGVDTDDAIPGIDGTEFTHTYLKFDLSNVNAPITSAKLYLYRTPDEWGYPGNSDPYPPPTYDDNPTFEYEKAFTGTITTLDSSTEVTGAGTAFSSEIRPGDIIRRDSDDAIIGQVHHTTDDTHLTLIANAASTNNNIASNIHYYKYNDPDQGNIKVYYETNNGWHEGTLKWNNEASGPNFADNVEGVTTLVGTGAAYPNNKGWYSWDVTTFAETARQTGEKILSLVLAYDDTVAPYETFHIFFSSEAETEALRPHLDIVVPPVISSAIYNHNTRRLTITFNEEIDVDTFTAANLGNLSIQDGTHTIDLDNATIITSADSTVMEATLEQDDDDDLVAYRQEDLRVVVPAGCGIESKDGGVEFATNTDYAHSTYYVYNTGITGTIRDSKSSAVVAKATVKLYDLAGNLKAEDITDTEGNFSLSLNSVSDGNYNLVISKEPLFKTKTQVITISGGDAAGTAGTVLIDPYGIVYDSLTGLPIPGATVTLYTASGDIYTGCPEPNPQSSDGGGNYNFNVAPGTYYLGATKDGYAVYTSANFTVTTEIIEWNIPMDPLNQASSTYLSIAKRANKKVATAGDIITYTINIRNLNSTLDATSVVIADTLPAGFKYIDGSTLVDGRGGTEPTGKRTLSWNLGTLTAQSTKKLSYRVIVTTEARLGKNENSAQVSATVSGSTVSAGPSISAVEVKEGLFSDSGMLIGKVFEDKNENGIQDQYEPGLPGVSLVLEDGTVIVTDKFGRYSVPNVEKGSHIIRLDQRVLPGGPFAKPKPPSSSSGGIYEREAIINRRQLDDWRREVLGQLEPEPEVPSGPSLTEAKTEVRPEVKPSAPPKILEITLVTTYSYAAKDGAGQRVIGMLDAASEVAVADILHKRGLTVISINKETDKELYEEVEEADRDNKKKEEAKPKPVVTRLTPRQELLNKYPNPDARTDKPRGQYRADIPKESKLFKIYGSETAKVNFPVRLLSEEEARKEKQKDSVDNQFMLVGLAEGTIGYMDTRGNHHNDLESSVNTPYKDKFYEDGSVKLYLKGLVKGEYLLSGKLNTAKDKNSHLFEYVNPEKYYPVYGDQSSNFNESETKGKFYARIDKDDSYALWGNYNTQEFTKTEFSRYSRTLAGANSHIELKDWAAKEDKLAVKPSLDFFYSLSEQEQVSQTFSAKGISGPFWLGKAPLLEYSESIRIETRDKSRSDVVLNTHALIREVDYEIDYDSGRILFKEPIPTRDGNDDPNYIVVDYEYVPLGAESKYYMSGTRLEAKMLDDKVTLGGQFISENHVMNNPRLYGFDTVIQPDPTTRLAAEWAYSDRYLDTNNIRLKEDNAWKVEGSKIIGRMKFQGYYSDIGNRFRNPVNVVEKGREKYGATADYQLTDATNIVLDHWRSLSTISQTFDRQSSVDIYHRKDNYFLGGGYSFQEYDDKLKLTPDKDINALNLRGGLKLTDRLVATLEEEYEDEKQDNTTITALDNKDYTTIARLDYRLTRDAAVYLKNRFVKELHKKFQNLSGIGFSTLTPDGESYFEYGFGGKTVETTFGLKRERNLSEHLTLSSYMNNRISGDKNEENVGFGTTYEIFRGLFTKFNFENTNAKNSDTISYKQNAQSLAFDYLPAGTENSYGLKFERRRALQTREVNAFGYAQHSLNKELSFILNSEYLTERSSSSESTLRTSRRVILGLAYRPIFNDKLNLLSKYEYKEELNNSSPGSSTDYFNNILSCEANYEINPKTDIFGKYALKFQNAKDEGLGTESVIDMFTTKVTRKFTDIFDVAGYYRIINDHNCSLVKQAPAVELGTLFFKRVRLGVGYNFLGYEDRDVSDNEYSGMGPYFNLGMKF